MTQQEELTTHAKTDLLERLAALEERTKPRSKNFVETLQAYGGLIALAIALLYSWPLGVWEKFVVTPQEKENAELSSVRNTLLRAAELTVEAGKIQSSIQDPALRDMTVKAIQNQILLNLVNNNGSYNKFHKDMLPEELVMIGLIYQSFYRIEESIRYFELAAGHPKINLQLSVEVGRLIGKSYFMPSLSQDINKGREIYKKSLESVGGPSDVTARVMEVTLQSEWGLFEMTMGDWKCGIDNVDEALKKLVSIQPILNDGGNLYRLIESQKSPLTKSSTQLEVGCNH